MRTRKEAEFVLEFLEKRVDTPTESLIKELREFISPSHETTDRKRLGLSRLKMARDDQFLKYNNVIHLFKAALKDAIITHGAVYEQPVNIDIKIGDKIINSF